MRGKEESCGRGDGEAGYKYNSVLSMHMQTPVQLQYISIRRVARLGSRWGPFLQSQGAIHSLLSRPIVSD
jgi:hypothetical protein